MKHNASELLKDLADTVELCTQPQPGARLVKRAVHGVKGTFPVNLIIVWCHLKCKYKK